MDLHHPVREALPLWVQWAPVIGWPLICALLGSLLAVPAYLIALVPVRRFREGHWTEQAREMANARRGLLIAVVLIPGFIGASSVLFVGEAAALDPLWIVVFSVLATMIPLMVANGRVARMFAATVPDAPARTRRRAVGARLTGMVGLYPHLLVVLIMLFVLPTRPSAVAWALLAATAAALAAFGLGLGNELLRLLRIARDVDLSADSKLARAVLRAAERVGVMPRRTLVVPSARCNAFAYPARQALVFTDGLVEALDEDAIVAITAHELGHLSEPRSVVLVRAMGVLSLLPILASKMFVMEHGPAVVFLGLVGTALGLYVIRRVARAMEIRADEVAHEHEGDPGRYARALEELYRLNRLPAVMSGRRAHPDLYDRLIAAGVQPEYERPRKPSRTRGLFVLTAVVSGSIVLLGTLRVGLEFALPDNPTTVESAYLRLMVDSDASEDLAALGALRWQDRSYCESALLYRAAAELDDSERAPWYGQLATAAQSGCDRGVN